MKNKKTKAFFCAAFFFIATLGWVIWKRKNQLNNSDFSGSQSSKSERRVSSTSEEVRSRARPGSQEKTKFGDLPKDDQFDIVFGSPISFYGKVVDENGKPVDGARVEIGAADRFWAKGSEYFRESDAQGLFSIQGIKGAGIYVNITKDGYYRVPEKSYGRFGYGMPSGREPHDQSDKPAIFMIHKKGEAEPLFRATHKDGAEYFPLGQKIFLDLKNGQRRSGNTSIEITSINDRLEGQDHSYTWRFIITVPGGEIIERNDPLQFSAPENGYQIQAIIGYDGKSENWKSRQEKDFFVKFANGTYGRVKLDAWSKIKSGFFFESYVNPSGSNYLEYDSSKSILRK